MTPRRIQLRRTAGWRKPEGCIVVSRPSPLGNMFKVGSLVQVSGIQVDGLRYDIPGLTLTAPMAVEMYRWEWKYRLSRPEDLGELSHWLRDVEMMAAADGHDVGCWCGLDDPCHGDVVIELAPKAALLLAGHRANI